MRSVRPFFLSLTLLTFFYCAPVLAADIPAETTVSAVTVYPDRATITRTAQLDVPAGASTLVVEGLPETLFPDSLRAEGTANGEVVLGALESKTVSSVQLAAPRERELNARLLELGDQRALLAADQSALEQKQRFLTTLSEQAAKREQENIADVNLKPEQWANAANTLSGSLADALRALAAKAVEVRKMDEEIASVQRELNQIQTGAHTTYQVRLPLEAKGAARLTLKVSYQLPNATWSPIYDARLDTATGKLILTQFGEVRQQTGEDWTGIRLTLSTAQPARGAALPPLEPMWVDLIQEQRQKAYYGGARQLSDMSARSNVAGQSMVMMAQNAASPEASMAAAPVDEQKAIAFQGAQINTGGFVAEYGIAGTADVKADGTARKVLIGSLDVTSQVMVKVKPQVTAGAFLIAVTKLGGESPLLPGSASLFRDGAYIGSLDLPLLRPGEETDLGFGIDDQIVVKQRVLKDETGESGVIARDTTRTRHTVTEIQNLHKMLVKVAVLQTVPTSQNDRLKLTLLPDKTLEGYTSDVDNIPGQLRWTFDLAPQQKKDVALGWILSWPKDGQLSGLPF